MHGLRRVDTAIMSVCQSVGLGFVLLQISYQIWQVERVSLVVMPNLLNRRGEEQEEEEMQVTS